MDGSLWGCWGEQVSNAPTHPSRDVMALHRFLDMPDMPDIPDIPNVPRRRV